MYNKLLDTFLTAAECGSLTKAAERLHISSTAVVKQINLLEDETGVRLFVRTRRGIALTDAGRAFQSESKKIIALSEESIRRVQRIGASSIQRIRLGTSLLRPARYFLHLWSEIYKKPLAHRVQIVPFLDNSYADYLNIVQSLGRNNEDNVLPLSGNALNVFGWASAYPVYGGTGFGALSDAYHIVDLLEGLSYAGIATNTELSDFYRAYREGPPAVGMWEQDWTLPEPPADTYSQELLDNAKAFSGVAAVVFARSGGEHIDLPRDVSAVNYTNNGAYEDFSAGTYYLEPSRTEYDLLNLVCQNFDDVILIYNGANTMEMGFVRDYPQIIAVQKIFDNRR